jgi:hypothetical protein
MGGLMTKAIDIIAKTTRNGRWRQRISVNFPIAFAADGTTQLDRKRLSQCPDGRRFSQPSAPSLRPLDSWQAPFAVSVFMAEIQIRSGQDGGM